MLTLQKGLWYLFNNTVHVLQKASFLVVHTPYTISPSHFRLVFLILIVLVYIKCLCFSSTDCCEYGSQIWAFEAIPFLGTVCARRVDGPVRFPRCLNWRCGETVPPLDRITTLSKDRRVCFLTHFM